MSFAEPALTGSMEKNRGMNLINKNFKVQNALKTNSWHIHLSIERGLCLYKARCGGGYMMLRCILRRCSVPLSTPYSSGFERLASGAFYFALPILTFYESIEFDFNKTSYANNIYFYRECISFLE